ncbi:hypothetical protein ACGFYF_40510 [Streptomyces lavendulae]|uniref:Vgb family protein n=1 Tax=Streptomyces lavendulae TaxID=1914 RepID=UPI00371B3045
MTFKNVFDSGGTQAGSGSETTDELKANTPGSGDMSRDILELEKKRDPMLLQQTAVGAYPVFRALGSLFQNMTNVSVDQRLASDDPSTTSDMASSTMSKANESVKVQISDSDLPRATDNKQYVLVAKGLGACEGLALEPSTGTAYITARDEGQLLAVSLSSGARRIVAFGLGNVADLAVDRGTTAYLADWAGQRVIAVDLSNPTSFRVVTSGIYAYGIALESPDKAYVASYMNGQLVAVTLPDGQATPAATGLSQGLSGVALDGTGKAYVGQLGGNVLYEIRLSDGTSSVASTLVSGASATRTALDGSGKAYVTDQAGGRLFEVILADGSNREVASGLGHPYGVAFDKGSDQIYVVNREGQLWRISQQATQSIGGVGKVVS